MKYIVLYLLFLSSMAFGETSKLIKFLGQKQGIYPTIYEVNNNYIPQISFKLDSNIESFFNELKKAVNQEYEVRLETLPKGKVISMLPTKKTLCNEHKLCDLSLFSFIEKRVDKMKLLSFVKAFDHHWVSLQNATEVRNATSTMTSSNRDVFDIKLNKSMRSSFIMENYRSSTILGESNKSFENLMDDFDKKLKIQGKRLGEIEKQTWADAETISGLYQINDESVFVLIQSQGGKSLVQVQRTQKMNKEDFQKIFRENNLIF